VYGVLPNDVGDSKTPRAQDSNLCVSTLKGY